jgi:hypothetical protein
MLKFPVLTSAKKSIMTSFVLSWGRGRGPSPCPDNMVGMDALASSTNENDSFATRVVRNELSY